LLVQVPKELATLRETKMLSCAQNKSKSVCAYTLEIQIFAFQIYSYPLSSFKIIHATPMRASLAAILFILLLSEFSKYLIFCKQKEAS
jgi:hypothetical protein